MDCMNVLIYLVGVLSVIVMLMIGWQIFNYISFEKKVTKRIEQEAEKVLEKATDRIERLNSYYAGTMSMTQARNSLKEKRYKGAVNGAIWAIQKFSESGDGQNIGTCVGIIRGALIEGKGDIFLAPTQKQEYIQALSPLTDDSGYELIKMIIDLPEE